MRRTGHALVLSCLAALASTSATAQQDLAAFVTDPAMCPAIQRGEDVQEMGMILNAEGMETIEYYCEFDPPISLEWSDYRVQSRIGFCAEPGFIMPTVFAVQTSDAAEGIVRVWQQGIDEATEFRRCPTP